MQKILNLIKILKYQYNLKKIQNIYIFLVFNRTLKQQIKFIKIIKNKYKNKL